MKLKERLSNTWQKMKEHPVKTALVIGTGILATAGLGIAIHNRNNDDDEGNNNAMITDGIYADSDGGVYKVERLEAAPSDESDPIDSTPEGN